MEERFITPDEYAQKAKEELENKRYRFAINEINEAIRYSTDKVQYMLIKVNILSEASEEEENFTKECKSYISSNLNLFYDKLSCDKFVGIIEDYNKCFTKYNSDIIDILKSKKIPYVLAYEYSSENPISTKEIIEKATNCQTEGQFLEALEHIRILETKESMCKESIILKRNILNSLQGNNDIKNSSNTILDKEDKEDKEQKSWILKNKKSISIGILAVIILFLTHFIAYVTGIIPSSTSNYNLEINSGRYAYLEYEDGIAIPIDETVNFNLTYKKFPFYGKVGSIEYTIDDYDIASIDENNNITGLKTGETMLNVIVNGKHKKSFIIKVVKPSVMNISLEYSKELNYVGDVATVVPNINREYDFGEQDEVIYKSTDESVITVDDFGVVRAVGIGSAYISVTCDGTTVEDNVIISPYVEKIKVDSSVELEIGDTYKFKVSVTTKPLNNKPPEVKFMLGKVQTDNEESQSSDNILEIDKKGNIKAIRTGTQEVIIKCGNYEAKSIVKVNKKSIKNSSVENIKSESHIDGSNLNIDLTWDALEIEDEHEYKIYAKINEKYEIIDTIKYSFNKEEKTISKNIVIDISKENGRLNIPIYIIASDKDGESKKSKVITVSVNYKNPEDISGMVVTNLKDSSEIKEDYMEAIIEWDNLDSECIYNIYVKDKEASNYKFEHKGAVSGTYGGSNSYSLGRYYEEVDLEVYIIAENEYGKSKKSNVISIRFDD